MTRELTRALRVLVCGGRDYTDKARVWRELDLIEEEHGICLVIHGGAPGADDFAESWAHAHGVPNRWFAPEWEKYGKAAGPIRNQRMLDEGKPTLVLAFPGGKGTADMVRRALVQGLDVIEVKEKG